MTDFVKRRRAERAEAALRYSEAKNRTLLEASTDAIFLHTMAGRIVDCNPAACEMFGYPKSKMLSLNVSALVPPQTEALLRSIFQEAAVTGGCRREAEVCRKDGAVFTVGASLRQVTVAGQNLIAVFLRDITGRKWAEKQLLVQRDLALALAASDSLNEAARLCLEAAVEVSGLDCGGICVLEEETGDLVLVYSLGLREEFVQAVSRYPRESPERSLIQAGIAVFGTYGHDGLDRSAAVVGEGLRAMVVIPVLDRGEAIACLNLGSHVRDEVPAAERQAAETIAAQMGHVIARLRAQEALRRVG
jgi:PAS domain S-box-containing protein